MSPQAKKEGQLPLFGQSPQLTSKAEAQVSDSPFSRYIVYVDESGDHSLTSIDKNYPVFVLAFCVFYKKHYSEVIVPALEKFKFNYFGHDQVVLHENEIRKEKGAFNIFRSKEEKEGFLGELTQIIEQSNFILISCTIDKRHIEKADEEANPYHLALGFCMETLHALLEEKGEQGKETHVVVESRGAKEDRELELEFRRVCDGANQLGMNLPFRILFSDKKAMSSGLQLADLVARPIGLRTLRPEQQNQAFSVLEKKFYCKGGRNSVGHDFEGYGMKVYPASKSKKPR